LERKEVLFPCGALTLEGILEIPDESMADGSAAVVCHPHPLMGGEMRNNVTAAIAGALVERGITALRFNFRGAGRSEGTHGEGLEEVADVRAAFDYLESLDHVASDRLIFAGYSFGSWVGLNAATKDLRPIRLIGIAPPRNMYDFSFLENETRPKLIVVGDQDQFCSNSRFKALEEKTPEPKTFKTFRGVDHFYFGTEDLMVKESGLFLDQHPFPARDSD
jgi:alpha/beta superfamily hydrolase